MFTVEVIVPIFICVVLPVMIVWLITRAKQNETNKRTEVMLKAIECGATVDDIDYFKMPKENKKGIKERLLEKLNGACVTSLMGAAFIVLGILKDNGIVDLPMPFVTLAGAILLAVGIALFVTYFVGKKTLAKEIEAEEKALENPEK